MQRQYRIEVFDNHYNAIGTAPIAEPLLTFDALTLESVEIQCARPIDGVKEMQLAQIVSDNGRIEYQGIVYGTEVAKTSMRITLNSLHSLFDVSYPSFHRVLGYDLWIMGFINDMYAGNALVPATYDGIQLDCNSDIPCDYEYDGLVNMYEVITSAFLWNGLIVKAWFDVPNKTMTFQTRPMETERLTVEAELDNVFSFVGYIGANGYNANATKVISINDGIMTEWGTFILNDEGNVLESDRKYTGHLDPLLRSYTSISGTDENPPTTEEIKEAATSALSHTDENKTIEISCAIEDKTIRMDEKDIGKRAKVMYGGISLNTVLTGVSRNGDSKTLTFGFNRITLTQILKMRGVKA